MSLLNYTNPSGASDSFPFPTDGSRKIYYQEVNNMFEQVRAHINGNIGPANFELPFASALTWSIGSSVKAVDITSISSQATIDIDHSTTAVANNTGVITAKSSAVSAASSSIIRSHVAATGSDAWPVHLVTDKASGEIKAIRFSPDDVSANYWTLVRSASAAMVQNVPTGSSHEFHVDSASQLAVSASEITTPLNIDALSFTAGVTVLEDGSLSFGDTADITKEGTDTVVLGEKVRIKDGTGPLLSTINASELLVQDSIRFEDANGPKISKGTDANNSLQIENQIELGASNKVVLAKTQGNDGFIIKSDGGQDRAAIVGSNAINPFKIYRGRARALNGEITAGSDITLVTLHQPGDMTLRISNINDAFTPIVTATPFHAGAGGMVSKHFNIVQIDEAIGSGNYDFRIVFQQSNKDAKTIDLTDPTNSFANIQIIAVRGD